MALFVCYDKQMTFSINNTKSKLLEIVTSLEAEGLKIVIFGGWSAELQKIEKIRPHSDIDLLILDEDFNSLIEFINRNNWEIVKSYSHKKAFMVDGIMVEVFLVKVDDNEFTTEFTGEERSVVFHWPNQLFEERAIRSSSLKLATKDAMDKYRKSHKRIHSYSPWK